MWRTTLVFAALMSAACSDVQPVSAPPSRLAHIETLRPVIACIEERVMSSEEIGIWQGGAPKGPAQNRETLEACVQNTGILAQHSTERNDLDLYRDSVLIMALMSFGDHRDHLSVTDFDEAMEIARCVETEATSQEAFFSLDPGRSDLVARQALLTCAPGIVRHVENLDGGSATMRRDHLAIPIAVGNLNYIRARLPGLNKDRVND